MLKVKFSTFRLCHATPTGSGTSPNILRDIRLTIAPYKPVSCALGILGLLDMMSPPINCSRHRDTGRASHVTQKPDIAASRGLTLVHRCLIPDCLVPVSYTHLRAHETDS